MSDTMAGIMIVAFFVPIILLARYCDNQQRENHFVVEQCTASVQHTKYKQGKDLDNEETPWRHAIRVYSYEHRIGAGFHTAHADLTEDQARAMCSEERKR